MRQRLLWLLTIGLIIQSCTTYHSRYYYQPTPKPQCFGDVCIAARAFSYQDEPGGDMDQWLARDSFYVSFRVSDETIELTDEDLRKSREERQVDAEIFRREVLKLFVVDSLVLRDGSDERIRAMIPDTARYLPQAANTFTLSFGWIKLPMTVRELRAMMFLTRLDLGATPQADSARFDMHREEFHDRGVDLMRDNVRGWED